ncbi:hypothetical protein BpHYR1_031665 [Brachionus plicatilis]|uniref:Uncharacterized protein n=1 Tax=Brachionus plicatilis TaxID=10195 RepID=A0A3M7P8P5_BRAPC|nr:hypothetical protein BpHYR1_031665 [Brachionus plicatilis]
MISQFQPNDTKPKAFFNVTENRRLYRVGRPVRNLTDFKHSSSCIVFECNRVLFLSPVSVPIEKHFSEGTLSTIIYSSAFDNVPGQCILRILLRLTVWNSQLSFICRLSDPGFKSLRYLILLQIIFKSSSKSLGNKRSALEISDIQAPKIFMKKNDQNNINKI